MKINHFLQLLANNNNNNDKKLILPFDIITKIVLYLTQHDCLKCMQVCHTWKQQVPSYSQSVWSQLRLYPTDITTSNTILHEKYKDHQQQEQLLLWEECIGPHVKHIIFDGFCDDEEEKLYIAMNKLVKSHCNRIESIEFVHCDSRDEVLLLRLLQKLASPSTKKLEFTKHSADLYFIHLINTCPNLIHFSYSRTYYGSFRQRKKNSTSSNITRPKSPFLPPIYEHHELSLQQRPLFPHLLRFTVESRCSDTTLVSQIKHVLEHSPNLQYLSYELRGDRVFTFCYDFINLDLNEIFTSCPKLKYFRGNISDNDSVLFKHTAIMSDDDSDTPELLLPSLSVFEKDKQHQKQLCYFMGCETRNFGPEKMEPHLIQNASTLEFLLFKGTMPFTELLSSSFQPVGATVTRTLVNWTRLLQSIHAPRLRKLVFYNILLDTRNPDIIPNMTSQCPVLEELVIEVYSPNNRRTVTVDIVHLANNTKQLKRLILAGITLIAIIPTIDNNSNSYNNNGRQKILNHVEPFPHLPTGADEQQKVQNKDINNPMESLFTVTALFGNTWTRVQEIYMNNIHLVCNDNDIFYMALRHLPNLKYLQVPKKLAIVPN
ncbi:hypothetical protein BDC45DRAFT_582036 [Circinella umbellata]|nr:hypothetical protein BDC45DRAFT_582036 [Circinella umbellata]